MKVLSLFDGISCGMAALKRSGIPVEEYVAYEIDENQLPKNIDLITCGSPCQHISNARKVPEKGGKVIR